MTYTTATYFTRRAWSAFFIGLVGAAGVHAVDFQGASDPAGLKRMKGSSIVGYEKKNFDTFIFPTGRFERYDFDARQRQYASQVSVEGSVTRLWYEAPGAVTSTELFRNYVNDLQRDGFAVVFDSTRDSKPRPLTNYMAPFGQGGIPNSRSNYVFFAAKESSIRWASLRRGGTYVVITAVDWPAADATYKSTQGAYAAVDVVEVAAMQDAMVSVSAQEMDQRISADGKVALYGILFDTDSAVIQAASQPALTEIAKLLSRRPGLRLRVVGHTDSEGNFEHNLALSRQRAKAVVDHLVAKEGVGAARLSAHGVADLAPVAANKNADGRSKNRRVELVPVEAGG